jgi:divinyl chlorophyllide a 8-vinyl-reductase
VTQYANHIKHETHPPVQNIGSSKEIVMVESSEKPGRWRWKQIFLLLLLFATGTKAFVLRHHPSRSFPCSARSNGDEDGNDSDTLVVVAGATGYIGRNLVRESVRRGHRTIALVRNVETAAANHYLQGCTELLECDVCDANSVKNVLRTITSQYGSIDSVVSCLASRSGIKEDAYAVDYQASLNVLEAARCHKAIHFCLLSAFCVQKPELQFQHAKLKLEAEIRDQAGIAYSIVRPTAFFKSVAGQFENIKSGKPIVLFGDGESAPCNPIAESDLAEYMLDCVPVESQRHNKTLIIGGTGEPVTHKTYNTMMSRALQIENVRYVHVPIVILDTIVGLFDGLHRLTGAKQMENAAEVARIIRYYAVEPMLTSQPEEHYGRVCLEDYYKEIALFGQEFDPYVSVYSSPGVDTGVDSSPRQNEQPVLASATSRMEPIYNVTLT